MIDYEVQRCTRHCAITGRELRRAKTFYSTLTAEGRAVVRHDYSTEAWQGPPEGVLGWWKSHMPERDAKKLHWAPNDVMLELLERLESQRRQARHALRAGAAVDPPSRGAAGRDRTRRRRGAKCSVLYCPRRETTYRVPTVMPEDERTVEIQEELARLLFADAALIVWQGCHVARSDRAERPRGRSIAVRAGAAGIALVLAGVPALLVWFRPAAPAVRKSCSNTRSRFRGPCRPQPRSRK